MCCRLKTCFLKLCFLLILVLSPMLCAHGNEGENTLHYYLSKSQMVVLGIITETPSGVIFEQGVINYNTKFKVIDVIKGDKSLINQVLAVNIVRFEKNEKDAHPLLKKGSECILFLKESSPTDIPRWMTADFWFGIQLPDPSMLESLKRLTGKNRENP